jgi:NAD(P)-dependent dehydrogenase (short-subunit alcohol dehydrogenase family)
LGRFVAPDDVAEAVVFLASDASASITGEDLNVSAGLAMY